ncbi:MAG TPA: histidine kinase [Trebonia sp.]|nr:histidine kinase [Trebonia sp.]
MRTSAVRWTAGSVAVASVALMAAGLALAFAGRHHVPASLTNWDFPDIAGDIEDLTIPGLAYLVASRRPRNPIGWLALTAGLVLAASTFCTSYALRAIYVAPGSLPGARAALWFVNSFALVPIGTVVFLFLLFPTGRLRSRRWVPVAWFEAAILTFALVVSIVEATRYYSRPFAIYGGGQAPALLQVENLLIPVSILLSVISLIVRFVKSAGDERLQLKWFATAAVLVLLTIIPAALTNSAAASVLLNVALFCMNGAVALAILKYRLYDIDIVISKALQYGALAAFITAVYAALVVGVGAAAGDQHSVYLSALAAAIVAVAFQPVRQRAALVANRLVYGRRATPYQVLSEFAHRIGGAYADDDVLPQMARMVADGTGARRVVVWLRVGGELRPGATAGDPGAVPDPGPVPAAGELLPELPDGDTTVPIRYQGKLLGALAIAMPRDEPLRPASAQLVADVAAQAGPVLSNAGLVSELRESRQRLVTAGDEARRRLERNLHDGAQQDLVALAIKLTIAGGVLGDDDTEARELLEELQADTAAALENLRALARGIYPPLLADLGLVAALNAQAGKSPVPVAVRAAGIGRFPQDTEAAVYFCCLEALQNTAKYARATAARISLSAADGALTFAVSDDGAGYDSARTPMGSGLRNMADRLTALGGRLEVRSAPGAGTTVTGQLPVAAPAAEPAIAAGVSLLSR